MNRREYLERLEQLLLVLQEEEREEALQYYSDYFDDAGIENEDRVILELGSPEEVAAKIRAGYAGEYGEYSEQGYEDARFQKNQEIVTAYYNNYEETGKNSAYGDANSEWKDSVYEAQMQDEFDGSKKREHKNTNVWKIIAIGLILLLAAPVILPLGIAAVAVLFALIIAVFAVVAGVGVSGFALLFAGIAIIVAGIAKVLLAPAVGILAAGIGCIILAIGIVISWAMVSLAVKVIPGIIRWMVKVLGTPFRRAGVK